MGNGHADNVGCGETGHATFFQLILNHLTRMGRNKWCVILLIHNAWKFQKLMRSQQCQYHLENCKKVGGTDH